MKSVPSTHYNQKYFQEMFKSPQLDTKPKLSDFSRKYKEISSLLKLKKGDSVVDFACGNADLSFYLSLLYNPHITAIDYSKDAIKIATTKLKKFSQHYQDKHITLIHSDNQHLPKLKNIKAVYLADVVEHLYPQELESLLKTFSQWGTNPYLLIHTDNSLYQFFIRPFINLAQLILHPSSYKQIFSSLKMDYRMHINLTNPRKLKKTLEKQNYYHLKTLYPSIDPETIKNQLGPLSKISFLNKVLLLILPKLQFLLPSFYSLYQYKADQK